MLNNHTEQEDTAFSGHVYPPKVVLSRLVNSLKGGSSRKLKLMDPELVKPAYLKNALWSPN